MVFGVQGVPSRSKEASAKVNRDQAGAHASVAAAKRYRVPAPPLGDGKKRRRTTIDGATLAGVDDVPAIPMRRFLPAQIPEAIGYRCTGCGEHLAAPSSWRRHEESMWHKMCMLRTQGAARLLPQPGKVPATPPVKLKLHLHRVHVIDCNSMTLPVVPGFGDDGLPRSTVPFRFNTSRDSAGGLRLDAATNCAKMEGVCSVCITQW